MDNKNGKSARSRGGLRCTSTKIRINWRKADGKRKGAREGN